MGVNGSYKRQSEERKFTKNKNIFSGALREFTTKALFIYHYLFFFFYN